MGEVLSHTSVSVRANAWRQDKGHQPKQRGRPFGKGGQTGRRPVEGMQTSTDGCCVDKKLTCLAETNWQMEAWPKLFWKEGRPRAKKRVGVGWPVVRA